jgi:hypothetical protein
MSPDNTPALVPDLGSSAPPKVEQSPPSYPTAIGRELGVIGLEAATLAHSHAQQAPHGPAIVAADYVASLGDPPTPSSPAVVRTRR